MTDVNEKRVVYALVDLAEPMRDATPPFQDVPNAYLVPLILPGIPGLIVSGNEAKAFSDPMCEDSLTRYVATRGVDAVERLIEHQDAMMALGRYEDAAKARDVRRKVEDGIMRVAQHVATTPSGQWTSVEDALGAWESSVAIPTNCTINGVPVRAGDTVSVSNNGTVHVDPPIVSIEESQAMCLCGHTRLWHTVRPMTHPRRECLACGEECRDYIPASVDVDFKREVPGRVAPVNPPNPRPVCAYATPKRVGEPVEVQWPECADGNLGWEREVVGTDPQTRRLYGHVLCSDALARAIDDATSRAVRTLRSLPVCPYGGGPATVTWAQGVDPGLTLGDRVKTVSAALECEHCSNAKRGVKVNQ
jgi:hypothetical protein